jgi:hypothetical protein
MLRCTLHFNLLPVPLPTYLWQYDVEQAQSVPAEKMDPRRFPDGFYVMTATDTLGRGDRGNASGSTGLQMARLSFAMGSPQKSQQKKLHTAAVDAEL